MTVKELATALSLTEFTLPRPDAEISGGYAGDLLSWVMGRAQSGDCWVTIMSNVNVAAVALMADVACVLLSEGVTPDPQLLDKAATQEVNLLGSPGSTFQLSAEVQALLRLSAPF
ncbi:conserved hypothetical protein [uncultured Eubacteriales bacterium]|uniref:DRTGG domain-containing protein n=1 Tax=uncultured Eubacteriales bacterium TaxID=172733 RepID=A0A212IXW1_9FIRM|nr:conserved hypothetical protein [uncultured Eubacteriales bacterium]